MNAVSNELENAYYSSIADIKDGAIVEGKVVAVTPKDVIIDIGYKAEGVVPLEEFTGYDPKTLDKVIIFVEEVQDEDGRVKISFRKANEAQGWKTLMVDHKEGDIVDGFISRRVKGGFMVNVFGVEGFLPQSLSSFKPEEQETGAKMRLQIVKLNRAKENFIVSRRDAIRIEKDQSRKKIWEELEAGKIIKGRVKSITNFGAFIDLGGVDGLLHIADMSWRKVAHPSEVVAVGDELSVQVLGFEKDKGKISLGLKQTTPDPWQEVDNKFKAGQVLQGRITSIQNYGLFVELEPGIEGLVHISEISWTKRFMNLTETYAIGDQVEAKIIGLDTAERKISLSIRQLEKDPWEDVESMVTIDSVIKGKVSGYGEGCSYLELENGLEGMLCNEDISWTKRVVKAQEVLKRGHAYETKVLGIDRANRKVILGLKQLQENPWDAIMLKYPVGTVLEGEVVKVANFGVFVKLSEELEGLVFSGEIDKEAMDKLKPKDRLKVKIIKIDPGAAKIGLSAKVDEPSQVSHE